MEFRIVTYLRERKENYWVVLVFVRTGNTCAVGEVFTVFLSTACVVQEA
jgi:hypothetical protein